MQAHSPSCLYSGPSHPPRGSPTVHLDPRPLRSRQPLLISSHPSPEGMKVEGQGSETHLSLMTELSAAHPPGTPSDPQTRSGLLPRQTLSTTCHRLKSHHAQGPPDRRTKRVPASLPGPPGLPPGLADPPTVRVQGRGTVPGQRGLPVPALPEGTTGLVQHPFPKGACSVAQKGPSCPGGPLKAQPTPGRGAGAVGVSTGPTAADRCGRGGQDAPRHRRGTEPGSVAPARP